MGRRRKRPKGKKTSDVSGPDIPGLTLDSFIEKEENNGGPVGKERYRSLEEGKTDGKETSEVINDEAKENNSSGVVEEGSDQDDKTVHIDNIEDDETSDEIIRIISKPEETEISKKSDISSREAEKFFKELKKKISENGTLGIYFHNDMDGLNGALFFKRSVRSWFGEEMGIHVYPLEYSEIPLLKLDDDITYVFIDMDINLRAPNIFRIDHHGKERDMKKLDDRTFVLTPPENDYEYPSTATGLCAYIDYVSSGGKMSYFSFLNRGPWHDDEYARVLLLLASVCDNLWHLNFIIDIPIRRWIPDQEEERYLILASISASIILGEKEKRDQIVERFFSDVELTPEMYLDGICQAIAGAKNILDFASQVSREAEEFYNRIFFNLTDSIDQSLKILQRDRETHKNLEGSMPIDMKGNRDKMMELLKTRGDLNEEHWRRIKFYGKELDKLEAKLKVEERRLMKLRAARSLISTEKGPRLCIVLPQQSSRQVKGIVASLLYYMGWKNVVIEERGSEALWGSRGFTRESIEKLFNNLSLGYEELKDYLFMEKVFKDLPGVFKRTLNISKNISFYKTYSGGMGGRGQIFGGILTGKVPRIFTLLEETGDMERKIKELMMHKELGNALQGFTEGQSTVSTAQALRAKFKSTGWLLIQTVQGTEGADILIGNFHIGIMTLVGYTERFQVDLMELPQPLPPMDHGKFEVAQ